MVFPGAIFHFHDCVREGKYRQILYHILADGSPEDGIACFASALDNHPTDMLQSQEGVCTGASFKLRC